jgi:hypothetical protein
MRQAIIKALIVIIVTIPSCKTNPIEEQKPNKDQEIDDEDNSPPLRYMCEMKCFPRKTKWDYAKKDCVCYGRYK